jgi:predicted 3-demethylubiquinone-9 3-methyltransferase (glyoxalase superfamily)
MPKITTFLTFNERAEEAVELYTSVFEDSKVIPRRATPKEEWARRDS